MGLKSLQLTGLASPLPAQAVQLQAFDQAQVAPIVGQLCRVFVGDLVPMIRRQGQKRPGHMDLAARSFFSGAFEAIRIANGGRVDRKPDGTIDEHSPTGALALFVGGTMQRGGYYATAKHYAELWGDR
jgi:hypothetical protein